MRRGAKGLALLLTGLAVLFPLAALLMSSLLAQTAVEQAYFARPPGLPVPAPGSVSLGQYHLLLAMRPRYLEAFWTSALLAAASISGQMTVAVISGYALARLRFRGRGVMTALYVAAMLVPFQVMLLPQYIALRALGLYDSLWALILPQVFAPMPVFLMRQAVRQVPDERVEALRLETSRSMPLFTQVLLPGVKPAAITLLALAFAEVWNMVEQPLIFLADAGKYPLSLALHGMAGEDAYSVLAGSVLYAAPALMLWRACAEDMLQGVSAAVSYHQGVNEL